MANKIFPSTNDVGPVAGDGRIATEVSLADWRSSSAALDSRHRNNQRIGAGGVLSGFDFSSGSATSVTLTAGTAVIRGYKCEETVSITGTLTPSTFNYVFLALTKTSGLVTGLQLVIRTAAAFNTALSSIPDDSILVWVFQTDATVITAQFDMRIPPSSVLAGFYLGDDAATRTIDLGFRPKAVMVHRFQAPRLVAFSEIPWSHPSGSNFGLYAYERVTAAGCAVGISSSRENRPQLEATGFSIEDGPATIAPGYTLYANDPAFNPSPISGGATLTRAVTVTGAQIGDVAIANHSQSNMLEIALKAQVTSAGTVTAYFTNTSGLSVDPGAADLLIAVIGQGGAVDYKLNELNISYFFVAWY